MQFITESKLTQTQVTIKGRDGKYGFYVVGATAEEVSELLQKQFPNTETKAQSAGRKTWKRRKSLAPTEALEPAAA